MVCWPHSKPSRRLRSYASPECIAFPQITQIAACCTFGTHRIPRACTFGAVAADPKRVAFQQLQGYITTVLKSLYSSNKVKLGNKAEVHPIPQDVHIFPQRNDVLIPINHLLASSRIPNAVFVHVVDSEPIFFRCGDDVRRLCRLAVVCYATCAISLLRRFGCESLFDKRVFLWSGSLGMWKRPETERRDDGIW